VRSGGGSGVLSAANTGGTKPEAAWARLTKPFDPPINLKGHEALGLWVHGDGRGEVLNVQLRSPQHLSRGIADHYIVVDFKGWRYFELIESESQRHSEYHWPYGSPYSVYREKVHFDAVEAVNLWYNNVAPGEKVRCLLSPVQAIPLVQAKLRNPSVTVAGTTITFPVEMETGSYLEFSSPTDCRHYGPKGELIAEVKPQGDVPLVEGGTNRFRFGCEGPTDVKPRARVTVIFRGGAI